VQIEIFQTKRWIECPLFRPTITFRLYNIYSQTQSGMARVAILGRPESVRVG